MSIVVTIVLVVSCSIAAYLIARSRYNRPGLIEPAEYNRERSEREVAERLLEEQKKSTADISQKLEASVSEHQHMVSRISSLETMKMNLESELKKQDEEISKLHKRLQEEFENIANRILVSNSQKIQQQHSQKLADILDPLKDRIAGFEKRVQQVNDQNIRENQSLKEQLKLLQELNKSIGEEARNLTTALKGQVKTQGNWGEMVLESILQNSGLVKDREYSVQTSFTATDGSRSQPDVLVHLPDEKTIVIDSKVSMVAYERASSSSDKAAKEQYLKEHLLSVKKHIRDLGEKKYHQLYQIKTLDFVLLFIPIEPAFNAAISGDREIFQKAFDNNIILVSPSTLLATLRTISSIWKLEYQNRNAREIAKQSGQLYDKFVGFINDMQDIDKRLQQSHESWDKAMKKLSTGRGNLVSMTQKIQSLGAGSTKSIPENLLSDAEEHK